MKVQQGEIEWWERKREARRPRGFYRSTRPRLTHHCWHQLPSSLQIAPRFVNASFCGVIHLCSAASVGLPKDCTPPEMCGGVDCHSRCHSHTHTLIMYIEHTQISILRSVCYEETLVVGDLSQPTHTDCSLTGGHTIVHSDADVATTRKELVKCVGVQHGREGVRCFNTHAVSRWLNFCSSWGSPIDRLCMVNGRS